MPTNIFQNTQLVARDAAIELRGALNAANLIGGSVTEQFAQKVGELVKVKTRPVMTARRHNGTGPFHTDGVVETVVNIPILTRIYKKVRLTAQQMQFNVDDFTLQVTRPAMLAMAKEADAILIERLIAGFARYVTGTQGTSPSTMAHVIAAYKKLIDNESPTDALSGIIDTTAMASFLALPQFTNRDYGDQRTSDLQAGLLSKIYNIMFYPNQRAGTQDQGDIAGVLAVNADHAAGATTLAVDGFTSATGTVKKGTRFTIAGDATVYTVITPTNNSTVADVDGAAIAGNAATLDISPALAANAANNAVVTIATALTENVIFHKFGAAKAIIAPMPQSSNPSSIGSFEGLTMRTTFEDTINDSTSGDSTSVLFDFFLAGEVLVPEAGVIIQGG